MQSQLLASVVAAGVLTASALLAPGVVSAGPPAEVDTKDNTCVPKAQAKCAGVVAKWTVEHHGNAKKGNFSNAKLQGADFRGTNLTKARFTNTHLKHAHLHEATLKRANLRSANLKYAQLPGTNLKNARLGPANDAPPQGRQRRATPQCAPNCKGANLIRADLGGEHLTGANLTGANLTYSYLEYASLASADLTRANLTDVNLRLCDLLQDNHAGRQHQQRQLPAAQHQAHRRSLAGSFSSHQPETRPEQPLVVPPSGDLG